MKILYVSDIYPSSKDVQVTHVEEVINNLSKLGNELYFIGTNDGKLSINAKAKYIFSPKPNWLRAIFFNLKLLFKIPIYIYKNKIQIIYTRQSATLISPAIISRLFSIPYITELNGTIEEHLTLDKKPKLFVKLAVINEKFCYKIAKRIITASKELKRYIIKKYNINKEKVVYIENGVNVNNFRLYNKKECRIQLNLNHKGVYGGYVGGLQNWQGIDYIIKSTNDIIKSIPSYNLIIVGGGPELENLKNLTKSLNLERNIIFKGNIPHNKIPSYINSFDVSFCYLTKLNEGNYGTPFKVYEYLSCGSPTILSKIKGIYSLFSDNIIIAKPEDSKDLANQTIKLLKNKKLLETLSKKGRDFVVNGHSWKNVAEKTQKVIEESIEEHK